MGVLSINCSAGTTIIEIYSVMNWQPIPVSGDEMNVLLQIDDQEPSSGTVTALNGALHFIIDRVDVTADLMQSLLDARRLAVQMRSPVRRLLMFDVSGFRAAIGPYLPLCGL